MTSNYSLITMTLFGLLGVSLSASCASDDSANTSPSSSTQTSTSAPSAPTPTPEASAETPTPAQAPAATEQPASNANTATPDQEGRVSAIAVREKLLCPEYIDLKKEGMYWGAPGGWRSFSQSFVDNVVTFVEAQWHGVNVGKMMCVYVGKEKRSFPVVLQNDRLVKMPSGFGWGGLSEGVVRCKSTNINDCPYFYIKRDVDIKKAYDELNFKKGQSEDLD